MIKFLKIVGLGALVLWIGVCSALLLFRHALIYPFRDWPDVRQVSGLPGAVAETFVADDGTEVVFWRVDSRPEMPTIFYFMGNAGSLPSSAPRLSELVHRGYGVFALNYRGAGGAPGEPRQRILVSDAIALYDRLADAKTAPVVYGTSLGAAVAVQLAARRPTRALILETPFARLCETAQHQYPIVPACFLLPDERWDSIAAITAVTAPVLILHGDRDRVIPLSQARKLKEALAGEARLIVYPGGRHNDLRLYGAGKDIIAFIEALPK